MKKLLLPSVICAFIICNSKVSAQRSELDSLTGKAILDMELHNPIPIYHPSDISIPQQDKKEFLNLPIKTGLNSTTPKLTDAEAFKAADDRIYNDVMSKPQNPRSTVGESFNTKDAEKYWKEGYTYNPSNPEKSYQAQKSLREEKMFKNILISIVIIGAGIFFLKDYMKFRNRN